MKGTRTASSASRSATLVWVRPPGVEEDEVDLLGRAALDPVDQLMLGVALEGDQRVACLGGELGQPLLNRGERVRPVERGFPGAQQVEVGPIKKKQSPHPPTLLLIVLDEEGGKFKHRSPQMGTF